MEGWSRRFRVWLAMALMLSPGLIMAGGASAAPFINIVDNALVLTPTPTDYANDYVEATGAAGMGVKVKTNSPTGMMLMVRSASGSPAIRMGDLLVRTLTPPGRGGTTLTTYTPLGPTNLTLWTTGVAQPPFATIDMDIRINNIFSYDDAGAAGTTPYTNTLIFTVIEP